METANDDTLIVSLIFLVVGTIGIFSGKWVPWVDRKLTEAYPWLSLFIFYNDKTRRPRTIFPLKSLVLILQIIGAFFAVIAALVLLEYLLFE